MTSRPTDALADTTLSRLADLIAGGQRFDHRDLLPGADDPLEGTIPEEFQPEVSDLGVWFQPAEWAGLTPEDDIRVDLAGIPAPATGGAEGDGMDFFRGGEAPDNYTNRHNPLYRARAEFVEQVTPRLNELFGVRGHAGHYRQPSASDADPGGRSPNSDHYSAGAVDFFGEPAQLDALRDYLVDQPWVSFIRWRSESHFDHLHASFDLGWVAQNFFQGRAVPPVRASTSRPATSEPSTSTRAPEGVV